MNINDIVEVELTSHGRLTLYKHEIEIGIPVYTSHNMTGPWLRMQLWELMHIFGPQMHMGAEQCFVDNVVTYIRDGAK